MAIQTAERRRALVVLGMHRSGTSALARILSLAGAELPANLMLPGPDNPSGFWESRVVADYNDEVLRALDTQWDDTFGPRRSGAKPLPIERFVPEARSILASEFGDKNLFVLKEPRISLLLELWQTALDEEGIVPHYIILVRRPDEIAKSLSLRNNIQKNRALLLWATYMINAEIGTREKNRVFVNFESLLDDPEILLDHLEGKLGIRFPRLTRIALSEIEDFIRPDLKHHNESGRLKLPAALHPLKSLYEFCHAASDGEPKNDDVPGQVAAWLHSLDQAVSPLLAEAHRTLQGAKTEFEERQRHVDGEVAQLRFDSDAIRSQLKEATARTQVAAGQAADLQAQLEAARAEGVVRHQVLEEQLAEAGGRAAAAQALIVELRSVVETNGAHLADLQRALDQERERAAQTAAMQASHAAELAARLAAATAAAAQGERTLLDGLARAQAEADEQRRQSAVLRTWGDELQREVNQARRDLKAAEELAVSSRKEYRDELAQVRAAADAAAVHAAELLESQLTAARESSEEREAALRIEIERLETESAWLKSSAADLSAQLEHSRADLEEAESTYRAEMAGLAARNADLQAQVGALDSRLTDTSEQSESAERARLQMLTTLEGMQGAQRALRQQLEIEQEATQAAHRRRDAEVREAVAATAAAKDEAARLRELQEIASRQAAALENALSTLEGSQAWRFARRVQSIRRWLGLADAS